MATETTLPAKNSISLWKYAIGGVIAGLITGILNNVWIILFPILFPEYEGMFGGGISPMSVSVMSFLPLLAAAFVYYGFTMNNIKVGTRIYVVLGILALLGSLYGPMFPDQMNDFMASLGKPIFMDEVIPTGFAILTIPMHIFSAGVAIIFIPRFVLKD